ncbi:MAG: conjugal transfer protein TraG N-terminal domain-containing protein [Sideroxyarcus sp.]|nr:conjugal transfer protein TraG N-terminal domain-containing protein [Sideroxyarcus sp.]
MYEVYAYWNVAELEAMFNAVASIMGSGDYLGLLRTMAIVGIIVVVIATLTGRERLDGMWKWLFFLAIFQSMLLIPKVTVTIVDRTGNEPPRAVANVPIGLGAFAHSMSKVGDWMTGAFETVFSLPDDVKFRKNGTLFGHRVLSERLAVKSGNPVLTSNLLEFYRECVAPDLATGYIRMKEDILEVNNVWGSLNGKTNPARLVTLRDTTDPTVMSTVGCDVAYQSLTTQINAESSRQITLLGSRLYPKMSQAEAGTAIVGSLATSTNYLLGVSASAQDAVKQAIVANFMIDAQYMLPAQIGDAASAQTNLAMAQSLRSTSDSYKLMARVAESTMPKVRNAIELIQYAIFPVFLLFVVLSGHQAGGIVKSYAASLFWIQLWAPLYAVMNFIITMYSRSQYTNGSAGSGLSIEQMSFLNTAIVSDQAIAGMLVISIPAIAAAIVKGGEVGLQSVAGLVAPPRDPEKIASALAMGNMQMGNASLNNVSHDTMKGLAVDMNPSLRQGMTNHQARGGFEYSNFSGGGFIVKQAKSEVRADMALNDSMGVAAKENYERSQQATQQQSAEYAESALAAIKQEAGFERSHAKGSSDTTGYRHGIGSSQSTEANETMRQVDQWARKLGVSEKVAMELMVGASMGMSTPKLLEIAGLRGGVEVSAKMRNSADSTRALEEMAQYAKESSFGKKVGTVLDNGWERNYRTSDEGKTAGSEGMRASLDHARQSRDAFSASMQETEGHRQMWEMSHSGQLGANLQLQDHFIKDFLLPKLEYNYEKFQGVMGDPYKLRPYIEEYTAQNYDRMMGEMSEQVKGAEAIQAQHEANRAGMSNRESVESAGGDNLAQVKGMAGRAGVTPQGHPSDQAKQTAMQDYSKNADEVNDRGGSAGQAHQENTTTSNFGKLKPESIAGKGMELAENVAGAANHVVKGVTGPNPGSYIQETLEGKKNK